MKLNNKLRPLVIATSIAISGMAAPIVSQAETSASVAVSNMYLWRGTNLSKDGGTVSGSLDYSMDGFYAGVWGSSETGGAETDLYLGYAGEVSDFTYDIGYAAYLYPEETGNLSDSDLAEVILSLGYGPVSFGAYIQTDSDYRDDNYFTLTYETGKFSGTYGWWDLDVGGTGSAVATDEYSHITLGFAATDELSFSLSKANSDDGTTDEDPLFAVTWSKSFDL